MSSLEPNQFEQPPKPVMSGPAPPSGAVTAVVILNYVFGLLNLLCGGALAFGGGVLASFLGSAAQQDPNVNAEEAAMVAGIVGGLVVVFGVAIMIFSLPMIVAGYGVSKRAQWGRILTIVLGFVSAFFALASLVQGNLCGVVFQAGYAVTVLVILFNSQYAAEFE